MDIYCYFSFNKKNYLKKLLQILLFLIVIITNKLYAQEDTFYHFGKKEGLSQESIQSIIKDRNGFIWTGTQEGLNRFDGKDFKIYKTDFDDQHSICGNDIEKLIEFKQFIFIGSKNNGVCYYDKRFNSFFRTKLKSGTCTSFTTNKNAVYTSILNKGLYKFEFQNGKFVSKEIIGTTYGSIFSLLAIEDKIYFGTQNGTIYYFNINSPKNIIMLTKLKQNNKIRTFYYIRDNLWIGTNSGLFKWNFINKSLEFINTSTQKSGINKIINNKETFFIATDNGLQILNKYDSYTSTFNLKKILVGDKNNNNSITSNRVYDLLFDGDYLWIGTNKLDLLLLKKSIFKKITTKTKPKINNNHIYAIFKTDKFLFIGTRNGLNCIDVNGKTHTITKENTQNKLAFNVIRDINIDKENNLWLATTKGVSVINLQNFNPEKPIINTFYNEVNNPNSLSNNNTRHIFIDNKNRVCISTYGGGINIFTGDLKTKKYSFIHLKKSDKRNSLSSDYIFGMSQSKDNTYWINTEKGLNKLTIENNDFSKIKIKVYTKKTDAQFSLKSNSILTSHIDIEDPNTIWIGTENGLHKFNIKTNKFKYFGEKHGLTNTVIYAIIEDENHYLWLTTNEGIFKFNKQKTSFISYNINDGLNNTEYNLGGDFYDIEDDIIYLGGTKGVEYFSPKNLNQLNRQGQLILTEINIKNKELNPSINNTVLEESIYNAKAINLNFNDFPTKIKFADIKYNIPLNTEFVYKLLPEDQQWNALKTQNEIQLLNLNPGTYSLLIQGKGKEKLWKSDPLQLNINVSPPWFKSNFAYLFYIILLSSLLLYISRYIYKRKLEHQEIIRLKEVNELKTKLYANITHEFRTPITVILGMIQTIKDKANKSKIDVEQPVEMIERNSKNLLNLVNQILDLSKLEKGKLTLQLTHDNIINHLKYLTESFHSFAEEKGVNLLFYNEDDDIYMDYDVDKITKTLSNLLSNAIKFCNENDKIIVHVKEKIVNNNSFLIIKIKDTGIGISENNLPFIFDRFYQAENNSNNNYDGTGIGLALTKELINLMKGKIKVTSKLNKGTTFTLSIPVLSNLKTTIQKNKQQEILAPTTNKLINTPSTTLNKNTPICLVVEDNKDVAIYIKMCLEINYQVLYAPNGEIGIEMAKKHIPDIIISDIMMPKKDGYELCKVIKDDIKTNHIPIILLTAKSSQDAKISGLKLGADAYLTKPFNKEELLIRLEKLIAIRKIIQNKYKNSSSWITKKEIHVNSTDKNDIFLTKVIEIINNNIQDNELNAKKLSELLIISESQLYRKIKALTNDSTSIYLRKVKLQKAKQLLDIGELNISQVCYETGFNNPSWFSKVFKKEFGYSPSTKK